MKNILFHMSVIFLLFVMVVMNTGETASARSVYKHKIFSKSVVSKRIDTIKQFYYKKSKVCLLPYIIRCTIGVYLFFSS